MPIVRRSKIRQRLLIMLVTGIGGMAAAAISFASAVYDAANPVPVPVIGKGQAVDTGRWQVTINGAQMSSLPPTGTKPFEPKRFLLVDIEVDNRSVATSNGFMNLITIQDDAAPLQPKPTYYLARDKWIASAINPNMPERLVAAWEWPADRPEPQTLSLAIGKQIYRPRDNLYGAPNWFDDGAAAVVELPVTQASETTEQ